MNDSCHTCCTQINQVTPYHAHESVTLRSQKRGATAGRNCGSCHSSKYVAPFSHSPPRREGKTLSRAPSVTESHVTLTNASCDTYIHVISRTWLSNVVTEERGATEGGTKNFMSRIRMRNTNQSCHSISQINHVTPYHTCEWVILWPNNAVRLRVGPRTSCFAYECGIQINHVTPYHTCEWVTLRSRNAVRMRDGPRTSCHTYEWGIQINHVTPYHTCELVTLQPRIWNTNKSCHTTSHMWMSHLAIEERGANEGRTKNLMSHVRMWNTNKSCHTTSHMWMSHLATEERGANEGRTKNLMSHVRMRDTNKSYHTISHMWISNLAAEERSRLRVMSLLQIHPVTHTHMSRHAHESAILRPRNGARLRVGLNSLMSHVRMGNTHKSSPTISHRDWGHTYDWVISHIWMIHVTHVEYT